jgi:hypothetical protein
MNWRRGLLRGWTISAGAWVVLVGSISFTHWYDDSWRAISTVPTSSDINPFARFAAPQTGVDPETTKSVEEPSVRPDYSPWWRSLEQPVLLTFAPPGALLILGIGVAWVVRGFRS